MQKSDYQTPWHIKIDFKQKMLTIVDTKNHESHTLPLSDYLYDLRRTFITIAEGIGISAYAVKHLANHKMKQDITSGYIITDVERLRKPTQQITD